MKRFIKLAALTSVVALSSCGDDKVAGENGINSIIATTVEPAGDNCANGGTRLDIGPDANANGTLETDEIAETIFSCSGSDGSDGDPGSNGEGFITLVDTTDEPAGANCADGGQRIDYGIDDNGDGVLDAGEIDGTAFVCDGPSGLTTLVVTAAEAPGVNCAVGGARLDHGVDDSDDGVLDAGEIDGSTFICNGVDGIDGLQTLVLTTAEAAGANCADGGQRIDQGLDLSADGVLDAGEIDSTSFVCNGADGVNGFDSLVAVSAEAAGVNCIAGGSRIDAGTDTSDDGVLDAGEVTSTNFACNGLRSLVFFSTVAAGGACGAETGSQLDMGLDLNNDGALQAGEISTTAVICDGADGTSGADGFEALVNQTAIAAGGVCGAATGVQVDSGIDANRNGVLDGGEVADSTNLCNGVDGANGAPGNDGLTSLILLTAEAVGTNCPTGGTRIDTGVDTNSNGILDSGEILTAPGFACNASNEVLTNGAFASGLAPWVTANNPVNSDDTAIVWTVAAGEASNGASAGPNAKIMFQDFVVPTSVSSAVFSLNFFQDNFDPLTPGTVQTIETGLGNAFRIDIIDPAEDQFNAPILFELFAPTDAIGAPDALAAVLVDDPALLAFFQARVGQSLRLRVAQVESSFPWQVLVDNVSLSL